MADLSLADYGSVLESVPTALAIVSDEGRLLCVNRPMKRLIGLDEDVAHLADLVPLPSDGCWQPVPEHQVREWDACLAGTGEAVTVSVRPLPNGSFRVLAVAVAPCTHPSRPRDGAASLFGVVLDRSPEGVVIADAAGRAQFVNRRLAEMLGTTAEQLEGASLVNCGSCLSVFGPAFCRAVQEARTVVLERHPRRNHDGVDVEETMEFQPLLRDGEVEAVVGWVTDVSEQSSLERQLVRSERMAAVGELAAGVAHNFNNILASIGGDAQLLRMLAEDENLDAGVIQSADLIYQETMRGGRIAHDLLSFARGQEPSLKEVEPLVIADDALRLARAYPGAGNVEMKLERRTDLARCIADPNQLHQVFFNLILNAVQAMPNGGALTIAGRVAPQPNDTALVEVAFTDTGVGIPPEQLERIFDPFFSNRKNGTMGTGLGLSVSLSMVRGMGGEITVESDEGKGTRVAVAMPIVERRRRPRLTGSVRPRLLLADDEPNVRRTVAAFLGRRGYDTVSCRDGAEALRLLEPAAHGFSAVVLDLLMPRLNGVETLRRLRANHPGLHVIVLTGVAAAGELAEVDALGVTAILPKPVDFDALGDAVLAAAGAPVPHAGAA